MGNLTVGKSNSAASLGASKPFDGQVAVVTGAARGVGRAIASHLCALGARVLFVARSADELRAAAAETGGRGFAFACDITADGAGRSIVEQALGQFGRLDILIHSAGVIAQQRVEEADLSALDDMYRVNVRAAYALTKAALPQLKRTQGQVLFVNSTATRAANIAGRGGFAGLQLAVKALADSLRDEVNEDGVRVISLIFGNTATPRQERMHASTGKTYRPERLIQPEDVAQMGCSALALPRTAEVTEIYIRPMMKS